MLAVVQISLAIVQTSGCKVQVLIIYDCPGYCYPTTRQLVLYTNVHAMKYILLNTSFKHERFNNTCTSIFN